MIFDRLESLGKYFSLHPAIKEILSLIADGQLSSLKDSSHETKRDDLFFSISTYETTKDDKKYEYHKRHADLFIMLKGKERCDYSLDSTDLTSIEFEKSDIACGRGGSSGRRDYYRKYYCHAVAPGGGSPAARAVYAAR